MPNKAIFGALFWPGLGAQVDLRQSDRRSKLFSIKQSKAANTAPPPHLTKVSPKATDQAVDVTAGQSSVHLADQSAGFTKQLLIQPVRLLFSELAQALQCALLKLANFYR